MLKSVMLHGGRERVSDETKPEDQVEPTPSSRSRKDDDKLKSELVPRVMEVCTCVCVCVCVYVCMCERGLYSIY